MRSRLNAPALRKRKESRQRLSTNSLFAVLLWPFALSPIIKSALSGIIISHLSHLLAVIALYHLTIELISAKRQFTKRQIAFIASCLHIISPAGLFLSAPYGESIFALLNFAGTLAYIKAVRIRFQHPDRFTKAECLWIIHAGTRFAFAAMVRSNGLLSGLIFAWDAIEAISQPQRLPRDSQAGLRFAATIFAGALVGLGFVAPQSFAWAEYCMYAKTRPWCSRFPPSIYSWVQDHYWGVGFMKYWTWNNLPLFLLAAPMLLVLLSTGYAAMRWPVQIMAACDTAGGAQRRQQDTAESMDTEQKVFKYVLPRLALPQLVLTVMAASSFHVQIINRISSGYPIWYVLLAVTISSSSPTSSASEPQTTTSTIDPSGPHDAKAKGQTDATMTNVFGLSKSRAQWLVRGMVLYAIIQGGLFASFLPPA